MNLRNLLLKTLLLFIAANLAFAAWNPLTALGRISAYNRVFPGRPRLPYGEHPARAYNLSLFNLDAMFASHELAAGPKPAGEYRVILIGDSSVWGYLLKPEETLSAQINALHLTSSASNPVGEKWVRIYNLGYPTLSLLKDLLVLDRALDYQPDLIIWLVTLESFPIDKQLASPIVQHNPDPVRRLIDTYGLKLDPHSPELIEPDFWARTVIGQRRTLADGLRLQLYGVLWAATGIDQDYPAKFDPPQKDFEADNSFHNLQPPSLPEDALSLDVLEAGIQMAASVPVLIVNEPVYLSDGKNSALRYNFFYPRWAYDQYRQLMAAKSAANGWQYLDLWNLVSPTQFTNSAIHLTPAGESLLAKHLLPWIP